METETEIIKILLKTIEAFKKGSLTVQTQLLLDSRKYLQLHEDILSELRRQNIILTEKQNVVVQRV